jgi:hypothetical protein
MRTTLQSLPGDRAAWRRRSRGVRAIETAIMACALGLIVPATMASAQTRDGSGRAVQPKTVQAAERHQARRSDSVTVVDAVEQSRKEKPVETSMRAEAVNRDTTRSKAMNRTAQAYLETQATGLAPLGMICLDCEFEPRPRGGATNSPIINGASIVVTR